MSIQLAGLIFCPVGLRSFSRAPKQKNTQRAANGSVILPGTPHGVGFARKPPVWLKAGDTVSIE